MSVQTEIDRIITAVGAAYDAVEAKGGTAQAAQTIEGLAGAISGIKSAPATPYMEAEYVAVDGTGVNANHYIKRAKLYNHTAIYAYEFAGQEKLENLDFSDASNNVTAIESMAFNYTLVNGLVLPNTIRMLETACFNCAYITTLTVPPLVSVLSESAFSYIQPVYNTETGEDLPINIILPQNLTEIGFACFQGALIKQIIIPDTVIKIGELAFSYCDQLASITCLAATPPALGSDAFSSDTAGFTIKVPAASVAAYKAADGWKDYASYIVAM